MKQGMSLFDLQEITMWTHDKKSFPLVGIVLWCTFLLCVPLLLQHYIRPKKTTHTNTIIDYTPHKPIRFLVSGLLG